MTVATQGPRQRLRMFIAWARHI